MPRPSVDPEATAIAVMGRIAADPDRLDRFLAVTGLSPGSIREAARQTGFLGGVLQFVMEDEAMLVGIAEELGVSPETIAAAAHRLGGGAWERDFA